MSAQSGQRFIDAVVFFRWWSQGQQRFNAWEKRKQLLVLAPFLVAGVLARLWAQTGYRNPDFHAYLVVSQGVLDGENPYETGRYNYGPVWFLVMGAIRSVAYGADHFRLALALLFSVVDVAIALILWRKGYGLGAALFMLAPVGIAISGQHQQFDNMAIFLALVGGILAARSRASEMRTSDWLALAFLSGSLMTKHIFLLLPLWLAYQQRGALKRLAYLVIPGIAFLLSLAPFMYLNMSAVLDNVFFYRSFNNSPFLNHLLPEQVAARVLDQGLGVIIFLALVAVLGLMYRRVSGIELVMVYAVTAVVFTSAIADQYLAIPLIAVTALLNLGYVVWLGWSSIFFLGNPETISIPVLEPLHAFAFTTSEQAYQDLFLPLLAGWIIMSVALLRSQSRIHNRSVTESRV